LTGYVPPINELPAGTETRIFEEFTTLAVMFPLVGLAVGVVRMVSVAPVPENEIGAVNTVVSRVAPFA
jgi:hypothetical protein